MKRNHTIKKIRFTVIYLIWMISVSLVSSNLTEHSDFFKIVKDLRASIKGYVLYRGSPDYETARAVHNGACRNIFPLILVKPLSTQDVAVAVKFSIYYDLKLSVRSGGHSYQCLGTKVNFSVFSCMHTFVKHFAAHIFHRHCCIFLSI